MELNLIISNQYLSLLVSFRGELSFNVIVKINNNKDDIFLAFWHLKGHYFDWNHVLFITFLFSMKYWK